MERLLCARLCVLQASKTETLPRGTRDGVARGDRNIAGPQQRHLALCALVLSSVKWAQCQIHRKHGMCVGCYSHQGCDGETERAKEGWPDNEGSRVTPEKTTTF